MKSKDNSRKRKRQRRPTESIFTNKTRPRKVEVDGTVLGEDVAWTGFVTEWLRKPTTGVGPSPERGAAMACPDCARMRVTLGAIAMMPHDTFCGAWQSVAGNEVPVESRCTCPVGLARATLTCIGKVPVHENVNTPSGADVDEDVP